MESSLLQGYDEGKLLGHVLKIKSEWIDNNFKISNDIKEIIKLNFKCIQHRVC